MTTNEQPQYVMGFDPGHDPKHGRPKSLGPYSIGLGPYPDTIIMNTLPPQFEDGCINIGVIVEDPRKTGLKKGLRQLTNEQIQKLLNWNGPIVLDDCNYRDGMFCPLAIAVGLETMKEPTDQKVTEELELQGYLVRNTRGIEGAFYQHPNRYRDLRIAAQEILKERNEHN